MKKQLVKIVIFLLLMFSYFYFTYKAGFCNTLIAVLSYLVWLASFYLPLVLVPSIFRIKNAISTYEKVALIIITVIWLMMLSFYYYLGDFETIVINILSLLLFGTIFSIIIIVRKRNKI
jgi:hypothetical protein